MSVMVAAARLTNHVRDSSLIKKSLLDSSDLSRICRPAYGSGEGPDDGLGHPVHRAVNGGRRGAVAISHTLIKATCGVEPVNTSSNVY